MNGARLIYSQRIHAAPDVALIHQPAMEPYSENVFVFFFFFNLLNQLIHYDFLKGGAADISTKMKNNFFKKASRMAKSVQRRWVQA